ncbi:hypothetical protein TW80_16535 [Loktanella sp. S4079]|nr:hypothetical protein TW80_16535 [Loktanella sp. S4079]
MDIEKARLNPIDTTRPATDQIAAELRAAILSMRLAPGQMLSENEVGQVFASSRTPVREAFAKLREDGLIETRPSRGTFVSMLSESQAKGAQFLRESLETGIAMRLCQDGLPDASRAALAENLSLQRAANDADDKVAFQHLDDQFHMLLADATGYDRLSAVLTREKISLDRLRVLSLDYTSRMSQLLAEHEGIFAAIQAQDAAQAVALTQHHVRSVLDVLSRLVADHQEYFKPQ